MSFLTPILFLAATGAPRPDTKYYVTYIQGMKISYVATTEYPDHYLGRPATRTVTHTETEAMEEGVHTKDVSDEVEWEDPDGKPLRSKSVDQSGGRVQVVEEVFGAKSVTIDVTLGGVKSHHTVPIPNGSLIDDPLKIAKRKPKVGEHLSFWSLDSETLSFDKISVIYHGRATTMVRGAKVQALLFDVKFRQLAMKVYATSDGDFVHLDGPMGMEVRAEPKEVALAKPGANAKTIDLVTFSSFKTDKAIDDPLKVTDLKLRFSGGSLGQVPSDGDQTISKAGKSWDVDVHPVRFDPLRDSEIAALKAGQENWLTPSFNIPSDSPRFKALAQKIVGDRKDVIGATVAVIQYVSNTMTYKLGIDVPRDASEILATKVGVCRDYAILTAALLRAAGIPTKLVVGLAYDDSAFFGHAWNEVWDGKNWVGIDPTNGYAQLAAQYVKLGEGNVEQAFSAQFPIGAKITILDMKR